MSPAALRELCNRSARATGFAGSWLGLRNIRPWKLYQANIHLLRTPRVEACLIQCQAQLGVNVEQPLYEIWHKSNYSSVDDK